MRSSLSVVLLVLALVMNTLATSARGVDDFALEAKYQEKIARSFLAKIGWQHELAKAKVLARESNRPILAYFTRSYAP